jgi:hypothetical protein
MGAAANVGAVAASSVWTVLRAITDFPLQTGDAAVAHGRQIIALYRSAHTPTCNLLGAVAIGGIGLPGREQGGRTENKHGGFEIDRDLVSFLNV